MPWGSVFSLIVALLYGVSPIDLIPDIIPLLGWMDDGVVGAICLIVALAIYLRRKRGPKKVMQPVSWRGKA